MNARATPLPTLNRRAVVSRLLVGRADALVVSSLGNPTWDVAAAGDNDANFYLWGAMGGALMVGLGLALAQPQRRVLVFAGDGEVMMALGALATAAIAAATNLALVVIDNEHYAETGMQPAQTGRGVDLAAVGRAVGFAACHAVKDEAELADVYDSLYHAPGPLLVTVKVSTDPLPSVIPPRDGPYLRSRFRTLLLGPSAHE